MEILRKLTEEACIPKKYYHAVFGAEVAGIPCIVSKTGYTGEDGVELYLDSSNAEKMWDILLEKGATAIFCMNDFMAGGTYDRLEELGLHAGKDVAVAGYDNREMACYEKPPLTTMALPLHDIGYKACQIIIGILTKEEVELDNGNCFVECIPCIRESVNAVEA